MKKIRIIFAASAILSILIFACFVDYSEISDYDLVSGIAIDLENGKWSVTCEICVPSTDNDFASTVTYVKGEGYTIKNAFEDAALKSTNKLYTDSTVLYLISGFARDDNDLICYLKSDDVNLRAVSLFTQGKASDIFKSEDSENERAKSISISKKIKSFCDDIGERTPKITELLKNTDSVVMSLNKTPERRKYE